MLGDAGADGSAHQEGRGGVGLSEGLRVEWARLAGLVENANAIVIATDEEGVVRIANGRAAETARRSAGELVGQRIEGTGLFDEAGLGKLGELAERARRGEGSFSTEAPLRGAEGERRPVSWTATALEGGETMGVVYWGRDLREARETEGKLTARSREIAEVASVMSHDLRAPLISIDGFAQNLLKKYGEGLDERGKRYVQRIREGVKRLNELIDSVLDLARADRREARRSAVKRPVAEKEPSRNSTSERRIAAETSWKVKPMVALISSRRILPESRA